MLMRWIANGQPRAPDCKSYMVTPKLLPVDRRASPKPGNLERDRHQRYSGILPYLYKVHITSPPTPTPELTGIQTSLYHLPWRMPGHTRGPWLPHHLLRSWHARKPAWRPRRDPREQGHLGQGSWGVQSLRHVLPGTRTRRSAADCLQPYRVYAKVADREWVSARNCGGVFGRSAGELVSRRHR